MPQSNKLQQKPLQNTYEHSTDSIRKRQCMRDSATNQAVMLSSGIRESNSRHHDYPIEIGLGNQVQANGAAIVERIVASGSKNSKTITACQPQDTKLLYILSEILFFFAYESPFL